MPALCTTEVEGTSKLNHLISSCARTFRVGFVALQKLNAMFGVYPEIYSGEFLSRMSQLKDDIESTAAQARILVTDEEDVWPSTARVTSLGDLSCLKGLRRCAGFQGTRENADQHLRGQILAHDLQARA